MSAKSPAIEPMLQLYQEAVSHHVAVFFVSGRTQSEYQATDKNLRAAGYSKWTGLFLKPDDYAQKSIVPFKSEIRAKLTKQGYTIIASIGDQQSDLIGGFAEKTYKLPNPYYLIN